MNEQLDWLEAQMERIIRVKARSSLAQTPLVLQTMRNVSKECSQSTLVEFVQRKHELRRPVTLGLSDLAWTWAERCVLEVAGSRLSGWNQAFYWRELDTLSVRGSVLLNLTEENIRSYRVRELAVVSICLGELLKVYEQAPNIFWRLHQRRSEALGYLAIRLPAYGADLN